MLSLRCGSWMPVERVIPGVIASWRARTPRHWRADTIATAVSAAAGTFIDHYLPIYDLDDSTHKFATSLHNCLIGIQIEMLCGPFLARLSETKPKPYKVNICKVNKPYLCIGKVKIHNPSLDCVFLKLEVSNACFR